MGESDNLKMKFKLHGLEFEIEGKEKVVKEQFESFKSFITIDLLPKINVIVPQNTPALDEGQIKQLTEIQDATTTEVSDVPALKEVVLKDLPKTETDWILIYACYYTSFGSSPFSEEDIKNLYEKTGRKSISRLANLSNNIKSLLNKEYIKVHNDTEFIIKPEGINYAHEILKGNSKSKAINKISKPSKSHKPSKPELKVPNKKGIASKSVKLVRSLNLRPDGKENLKEFAKKYNIDSAPKQIVVIVYYLKELLGLTNITADYIFTGFDELNIRVPKNLVQIIINTKNRNGWLDYESMDNIGLSVQGLNAIKFDLLKNN